MIISSHADCERGIAKCLAEFLPEGLMRGTFDNAVTNASLLYLMLDVTDMGWHEGADFTVENNFWDDSIGMKVITCAENFGFNWRFVPEDPDDIPGYIDIKRVIPVEAEADESWEYDENDIRCFSFCIPVLGEMHSNEGVYARYESFERYTKMISEIASAI